MKEDFVTQLRLQLRDAAERDARRGPLRRAAHRARWDGGRPLALAAAAAALIAALAVVVLPYLRGDEPLPAGRDLRIAADTQLLRTGGWVLPAYGSVWMADPGVGEIVRVDPDTREPGLRIPVGGDAGLGAAEGWLWAAVGGELLRIDPADGKVTGRLDLGAEGLGLPIAAGDTVWLVDALRLRHVDPDRMAIDRTLRIERGSFQASGFAVGPDVLYVQTADSRIAAYDAGTGDRTGGVRLQRPGELAAYSPGGLVMATENGLATIDPETGEPVWTRPLGVERVNGIVVADGTTLWVHGSEADGGRDRLWRIDALDGRVLGSIDLPGFGVAGLAWVGAEAWVVTPGGQLIVVAAS
jgi:sugar lactone lactonase YvrE